MTLLLVARHGNTFNPGEAPRRIGARTDLPLSPSGRAQAETLGHFLREKNLLPTIVYTSTLRRTQETAELALRAANLREPHFPLKIFDEIDYGPDENQPEDKVLARIGAPALTAWEEQAIPPQGWLVNPEEITKNWQDFLVKINKNDDNYFNEEDIVLVLTSNGIARFLPALTHNFASFMHNKPLKLSTGALGILGHSKGSWHLTDWNLKPAAP